MTVNGNNQITDISNRNHTRERYQYDSCGYLSQRQVGMPHGITLDPFDPHYAEQQLIGHNDIYQPGHKLHRLHNDRYVYDRAGRLIRKTTEEDGYRTGENHYRWNGFNQLTVFTGKGKLGGRRYTWYYKYDGIGRRIEKACPEQNTKVRYVWDGDQLAYTLSEKNQQTVAERHSVFNGWQLIAQQDSYQTVEQTQDGNIKQWQEQTHYAIVQPNGKVIGLLTPKGELAWQDKPRTLWGLVLDSYQRSEANTHPLDPQLLFAGQYADNESGLAYNRFRYYDPSTGNYLTSDPIGLNGGETPYSYVQNPWDWLDPFGLASCNYRKIYMDAYPKMKKFIGTGKLEVHHRIPQVFIKNGKFPQSMKTSLSNLQGLPTKIHRQVVTPAWEAFRKTNPNATKAEIMKFAANMDKTIAQYINKIN
ncbi:RHS repeat-associated core domain-containing protein [Pasteurella testudinis]|uniref:RHS repeat-associated core domain-containing protein n=1 Tax=Pasteurella testudinis TaxID=761 RepID=UPI000DFF6E0A|nr:RHS repeat-associated core domain-containing protein [Pasteurella testudinis]SUB52183.1 Cell wall-associated polypeptide CWBP200 [Pasteurella testudinis]